MLSIVQPQRREPSSPILPPLNAFTSSTASKASVLLWSVSALVSLFSSVWARISFSAAEIAVFSSFLQEDKKNRVLPSTSAKASWVIVVVALFIGMMCIC